MHAPFCDDVYPRGARQQLNVPLLFPGLRGCEGSGPSVWASFELPAIGQQSVSWKDGLSQDLNPPVLRQCLLPVVSHPHPRADGTYKVSLLSSYSRIMLAAGGFMWSMGETRQYRGTTLGPLAWPPPPAPSPCWEQALAADGGHAITPPQPDQPHG
jgi:hypothetical protein